MDFKETRRLRGHVGAVLCARYTKDGTYAVTCGADRGPKFWDVSRIGATVEPDSDEDEPAPPEFIAWHEAKTSLRAPPEAATWKLSEVNLFFLSGGAIAPAK